MSADTYVCQDTQLRVAKTVATVLAKSSDDAHRRFVVAATFAAKHLRQIVVAKGMPQEPVYCMRNGILLTLAYSKRTSSFYVAGFVDLDGPEGFDPDGQPFCVPARSWGDHLSVRLGRSARVSIIQRPESPLGYLCDPSFHGGSYV